jgi:hypothetical protein
MNYNAIFSRIPLFRERKCRIDLDIQELRKKPPDHCGPFIKLDQCREGLWSGDILFVHKNHLHPILCLDDSDSDVKIVNRIIIGTIRGYDFTRWTLTVHQKENGFRQDYFIKVDENRLKKLCFFVPGIGEAWKWAFFSCNDLSHTSGYAGYSEKYGGITPLWADLVHKHHEVNYHMMIGLGDQVYLDEVFEHVKSLSEWTFFADRAQRENIACPESLLEQVDEFTFLYYMRHFSQPYFDQALAMIPHLLIASDHDFYDGQGSYPPDLENSPILREVRKILQKYYLLFQQHQDPDVYFSVDKVYGDSVAPFVKTMGEQLAILGLDTRFERTRDRIIKAETYDYIFSLIEKLPHSTVHLVVATEIPLLFPDLRWVERQLKRMSDLKRNNVFHGLLKNVRTYKWLGLPFGEPLLLSDMIDHWNSVQHIEERNQFIFRLQELSKRRSIRITFIGGDVHCAGVGRFATPSPSRDKVRAHYENNLMLPTTAARDHRLMYQVISSAIANVPPPSYIIKAYHILDKPEKIESPDGEVTDGRMLRFFLRDTKGRMFGRKAKKLMGARNWASAEMSTIDDSLFFELHAEMFLGAGKTMKYSIIVPALDNQDV